MAGTIGKNALQGFRLLVVEDDYFIAHDTARRLEDKGAQVIGPVATVAEALALFDGGAAAGMLGLASWLDGAVLDLNLGGEMAFPVADALRDRGVPFVFATGYAKASIPQRYSGVTRCEKPVDLSKIARVLFG